MSVEERNKDILRRWEEMWKNQTFKEHMAELAGPTYTRHEPDGTRTITVEEYCEQIIEFTKNVPPNSLTIEKSEMIAEGDKVATISTWKGSQGNFINFVQVYRLENEKLVETWHTGPLRGVRWDW
jgi:predicted SnoaL-like aldol condensation-catalyzing enzyme